MSYLDELDAEQRAAATATATRVRCAAGAGTGKTRTLTARVIHLIEEQGIFPADILAVTFSKRAATELAHRLGDRGRGVEAGTLHALGYRIIRSALPWAKVADEALSRRLIRKAVTECGREIEPAKALQMIPRFKMCGLVPDSDTAVGRAWLHYQALLREQRVFDFNDLILKPVELLNEGEKTAEEWVGRWAHVLVDEVQDTSRTQWTLLEALVPGMSQDTSVFIVGDVQQGIYSWRGADPALMLDGGLEALFGPFESHGIRTNYRSGRAVVSLANGLMRGHKGALELVAQRELAAHVEVLRARDESDEARQIIEELQAAHDEGGLAWRECAVLYRTNGQSAVLEAACGRAGVPYTVVGGVGFFNRAEVLDVLAYLRLALEWDAEALDRIYNRPSRYLGHVWRAELEKRGGWKAFETGPAGMSFSRWYMDRRADELWRAICALQAEYRRGRGPAEMVAYVCARIGYRAWLLGEEPDDADECKGEILDALIETARQYDSVEVFLDFAAECQSRGKAAEPTARSGIRDRVQLSTIHRAKGLEWPLVIVAGFSEGLLPHRMAGDDDAEERRVCYVALTRARDTLLLSYHGEASRYLRELGQAGLVRMPGPGDEEDEDDDAEDHPSAKDETSREVGDDGEEWEGAADGTDGGGADGAAAGDVAAGVGVAGRWDRRGGGAGGVARARRVGARPGGRGGDDHDDDDDRGGARRGGGDGDD